MELFRKAITVRLSYKDKYLTAEDDQESVCLDRDGSSKKAIWAVEFIEGKENYMRLVSCYGKYLMASNAPLRVGSTRRKVVQAVPRKLDSSIEWEPVRDGFSARFKTPYGNFLRPNGGLPPWRNSVTHDFLRRMGTKEKILWDVEVVEAIPKSQSPLSSPSPAPAPEPSLRRVSSSRNLPSSSQLPSPVPNLRRVSSNRNFPTERTPPTLAPAKFSKVKH